MARWSISYSINGDVNHVCTNCKEGHKITWRETRKSTGRKKMCSECRFLVLKHRC